MRVYVVFNTYYGAEVPLGITLSKEQAIKETDNGRYFIKEYEFFDDTDYFEFPE